MYCLCVCLQSLGVRQRSHAPGNLLQALTRELLHRDDLQEIEDAQPAAKARSRAGRQRMIWSGGIISDGLC